jgi:hypothetical protein
VPRHERARLHQQPHGAEDDPLLGARRELGVRARGASVAARPTTARRASDDGRRASNDDRDDDDDMDDDDDDDDDDDAKRRTRSDGRGD